MTAIRRGGFTLIEILVVVALVVVLSLVGAFNVLRARTTGNEGVALANLRQLSVSLLMYNSINNAYPADFTWRLSLYGARCGPGHAPEPDYGPANFCLPLTGGTSDNVSGYVYSYQGAPAPAGSYTLTANPQTANVTGTKAFFVDQTNSLRHCIGAGPADATDPTIDQPPVPC